MCIPPDDITGSLSLQTTYLISHLWQRVNTSKDNPDANSRTHQQNKYCATKLYPNALTLHHHKGTMKSSISRASLIVFGIHVTNAFVTGPAHTGSGSKASFFRSFSKHLIITTTTKMKTMTASSEGTVIDLADSNFAELFHSSDTPLLIDAYSTWCGPCKLIEPILQKCATDYGSRPLSSSNDPPESPSTLTVARWNVEAPSAINVKIELLLQGANPSKLPTLILAFAGTANIIHEGLITQEKLNELLAERLAAIATTTTVKTQKEIQSESRHTIKDNANVHRRENETQNSKRQAGFISFMALGHTDDYMIQI